MDIDEIIESLASSDGLPRDTLQYCIENQAEVTPAFLAILNDAASGKAMPDDEFEALFLIIHLLGGFQEKQAYRPLVEFLRQSDQEDLNEFLNDAITETIPKVLISVFDGDVQPLVRLIEDVDVDEFVRDAGFAAWTYFAAKGVIAEDDARRYLLNCLEHLQPKRDNHVWVAWVDAVAILGFSDLRDEVQRVMDEERRLPDGYMVYRNFEERLQASISATDQDAFLRQHRLEPFTDTIEVMSRWVFSAPEKIDDRLRSMALMPSETVTNPMRHVGRNDPCPCGSGKKFKKCCLH